LPLSSGIILLDKPRGWTSRKAVNEVVRLFSDPEKKRIRGGHTGTLDPMATGMLPVLLGEATRFAGIGLNADKAYKMTIDLSFQTDTLDAEGQVTARFNADVDKSRLQRTLALYRGDIEQVPPAYSAIRVAGKRAYDMARKGNEVILAPRPVSIHELRLLDVSSPRLVLFVRCSKGTYMRALARDIGASLGMGGCVTALRRLSTGGWPESAMLPFAAVAERREACVVSLNRWLRHLPRITLAKAEARRFAQGQRIQQNTGASGDVAVYFGELLLGTGRMKPGLHRMVLHPVRGLPSAQKRLLI